MQNATLIGNLCSEPELRFTNSGKAVAGFRIAVNKYNGPDKEESVSFYDVTAWESLGENAAESLHKGTRVVVVGRLELQTWEDKDTGDKRSKVVIIAEEIAPGLRWAKASVTKTPAAAPSSNKDADVDPFQ